MIQPWYALYIRFKMVQHELCLTIRYGFHLFDNTHTKRHFNAYNYCGPQKEEIVSRASYSFQNGFGVTLAYPPQNTKGQTKRPPYVLSSTRT